MANFVDDKTGKIEIQQKGNWYQTHGLTEEQAKEFNDLFKDLDDIQSHRINVVLSCVWLSGFGKGTETFQ